MRETEMDEVNSNSEQGSSTKIFISYRREDTKAYAGRLHDHMVRKFGADRIFMDIDNIKPGDDFIKVIEEAVTSCDVLLALIGKDWLTVVGADGRRRLDNPKDFVRVELDKALNPKPGGDPERSSEPERRIRVIPILVEGATMPQADELPPPLQNLVRLHASPLRTDTWWGDVEHLLQAIEKVNRKRQEEPKQKPERPAPPLPLDPAVVPATTSPAATAAADKMSQPPEVPQPLAPPPGPEGATRKRLSPTHALWAGLVLAVVLVAVVFSFNKGTEIVPPPPTPTPTPTPTLGVNLPTPEPTPEPATPTPTPTTPKPSPTRTPPPPPPSDFGKKIKDIMRGN
jgi:hypothetical protein